MIYWVFVKPEQEGEEIEITPVNDNDFDDFSANPWDGDDSFNFKAKL